MGASAQPVRVRETEEAAPTPKQPTARPWAQQFLTVVRDHDELSLVLTILIVSFAFHWVPHKIAFLNFFYLPVLAAGYLLGVRRAIYTTLTCVLVVLTYYAWAWTQEGIATGHWLDDLWLISHHWEMLLNLSMWGGFLILTGIAFANTHEKMARSYSRVQDLNQELQGRAGELQKANEALGATASELEQKAEQLQEKNLLIEKLKQQMEQTLYTTIDATVARLMIQGRLRQEKRNISVLFCDLKNFSAYSEHRPPEVILEDLNSFYGGIEKVIETYHGHIDKYMGDGIMCEFGAPMDYEQHCLQAVVAGLKIRAWFERQGLPWGLRIGITSGDAVVGLMGARRRSYSALGDVVNLAQRLEELCEPGQLYADETLVAAVRPFVEVEQIRSLSGRREQDKQIRETIERKEHELARNPKSPELLLDIGILCMQAREATKALGYLRRAMELKPEDRDIKVAYADASIKVEEYERIAIRGLAEKRAVFKVLDLAKPLLNPERCPPDLVERYRHIEELMEIPDDFTLPVEVIDGSVGHSLCVAFHSYVLADQLDLPEELKRHLLIAGQLPDLGKSEIWHHTLNRRGGLSDQERKELEGHVSASVSIAKRMGYDQPGVIEIIAGHHERLDGRGFPQGLKGEQIPLGARISAVADVYCALTAWRPYRPAWDSRVALSELRKGMEGGKFDPEIVSTLEKLVG